MQNSEITKGEKHTHTQCHIPPTPKEKIMEKEKESQMQTKIIAKYDIFTYYMLSFALGRAV